MKKQYLDLIKKASFLAKPIKHNNIFISANVASALLTNKNNIYTGVSLNAECGIGFCAEHNAIAQMVNNKETKIIALVAVNLKGKIIPPCGRCRELIYQINYKNLYTDIIIENKIIKLKDLLSYRWQELW